MLICLILQMCFKQITNQNFNWYSVEITCQNL